jgi:TonB-linked SusC/RagA family outer membrane protein
MIKIKNTTTLFFVLFFSFTVALKAQEKTDLTVTGTVVDAVELTPLTGISVQVGKYSSVFTNDEGAFSIKVPSKSATLKISNSDYQTKEVDLRGRIKVSIQLYNKSHKTYYESVEMPMNNKSKKSIVSAIATKKGTISNSRETVSQLLNGEISGLRTIMRSGTPGIGGNIFLRGYNTLNGNTQPLIIIDGMMIETNSFNSSIIGGYSYDPLSDINVKDIANITVIKDAASIYGSKGANGVILIETNKTEDISTKIEFFTQSGINYDATNLPMMNASQFKSYLSNQLNNSGLYTNDELNKLPYFNENTAFEDYGKYHNSTDWQKEVFDNSFVNEYYLRVSGGDEISKYGLSVGYTANNGTVKNSDYQRFTTRFNAKTRISEKLSLNTNLSVSYASRKLFEDGLSKDSPIFSALNKAPFLGPFTPNGDGIITDSYEDVDNVGAFSNPTAIIDNATFESRNYNLYGHLKFMYKINDKLHISSLVGVNYLKNREDVFLPDLGLSSGANEYGDLQYRTSEVSIENLFAIYNDTRLSYSLNIDHLHQLQFNIGGRYNENNYENSYASSGNSGDDQFTSLNSGDRLTNVTSGSIGNWKDGSLYSNVDYSFLDKYFVSFNMAIDWSSRFGESSASGVFPSLAAAWVLSSEDFMADNSSIDLLKLRASYGLTGNDGVGNYNAKSYFVSKRFLEGAGLVSGNIANSSIQWEETTKANLGIDLGLFNERLSFNADFYNNVTNGLLNVNNISPIYGYDGYMQNNGELRNNGLELGFNAKVIKTKDFEWNVGGNISKYKNEIISLPDGETQIYDIAGVNATIINQEGSPLGLFYGYKTDGIYQNSTVASSDGLSWTDFKGFEQDFVAGDVKFVNTDNTDNVINEDDRVVIGNPNADFTGMFYTSLSYKELSLSAVFTFSKGNDVYNALRRETESMSGFANQSLAVVNRWSVENQDTNIPRAVYGDEMGNSRFSDRWIEDGSYIRLKTLTLSYSPEILKDGSKNITIYLTGNNLLTFTKYLGYDPEVSFSQTSYLQGIDAGRTPQFSSVMLGVKLGL